MLSTCTHCSREASLAPNFEQSDARFSTGPNQDGQIVRGFDFVNKPGLQPGDCDSLHAAAPASETAMAGLLAAEAGAGGGAAADAAGSAGDQIVAEGAQRRRRRQQ